MAFKVEGSGFRVQGVQGSGFRVQGSGFRIKVVGMKALGAGFGSRG